MPVEVKGLIETQRALKAYAPDLFKEMRGEIRTALKVVIADAKNSVSPNVNGLFNWQDTGKAVVSRTRPKTAFAPNLRAFPKYDQAAIRKGLTFSVGTSRRNTAGYVGIYRLLNRSAAGAIVETAGRKNFNGAADSQSNNMQAGAHFNRAIQGTYGGFKSIGSRDVDKGRLLYAAYVRDQGKVTNAVFAAINKTQIKFKARLGLAA